jgi:hypothetical protein
LELDKPPFSPTHSPSQDHRKTIEPPNPNSPNSLNRSIDEFFDDKNNNYDLNDQHYLPPSEHENYDFTLDHDEITSAIASPQGKQRFSYLFLLVFHLFFLFIVSRNNSDHDRIPSFTPSSTLSRSLQQPFQLTLEPSTPGKTENRNDLVNISTDSASIGAFFEEKDNNYDLHYQHSTFSLKSSSSPVLNKNRKRSPNKFVDSQITIHEDYF